jgi:hypothetical protein
MENTVMKITWTIAALAGSVTLVGAQVTPRPPAPAAPTAPAPSPRPRAERPVEPLLAPLPDVMWLLDAPSAMHMIAPEPLLPLAPLVPLTPMQALAPFESLL